MLTQSEALERLKEAGVTSSIQVLRKWVREGQIKAKKSHFKKEGYRIHEEDLERFIEERNPLYKEVKRLREENRNLKQENMKLKTALDQAKKKVETKKVRRPSRNRSNEISIEESKEKEDEPTEPISAGQSANNRDFELNLIVKKIKRMDPRDPELQEFLGENDLSSREFEVYLSTEVIWQELKKEIENVDMTLSFKELKHQVFYLLIEIMKKKKEAHLKWVKENA
jgi:regulator of replication initiation timing